jgi:hypothetical protein
VTYPDPTRDSWTRDVVPKLQAIPLSVLMRETGLSRRMLIKARTGKVRPHPRNRVLLVRFLNRFATDKSSVNKHKPTLEKKRFGERIGDLA